MIITGEPKQVAAAYVKARSEIESIMIKDGKGARGKFVKLASIIEAISPILFAHELVLMQEPTSNEFGVGVSTCLLHSSGSSIDFGPLTLPVADNNPHTVGSALSYARRYAISAVFGLAAEDDDGQAAQDARQATQRPVAASKAQAADNPFEDAEVANDARPKLSEGQLKELNTVGTKLYGAKEWGEQRPKLVEAVSTGVVTSAKDLTPGEADKLIKGIKKRINEREAQVQEPVATAA